MSQNKNKTLLSVFGGETFDTKTLTIAAILTSLVIALQFLPLQFGFFRVTLVLMPITLGAALCGPKVATWLGFVFGAVVLGVDAGAFLGISIFGTVVTVLLKGALCGLAAGVVFRLLEKKSRFLATAVAAVLCPIVNTGVFLLGCVVFFLPEIREMGADAGYQNAFAFMVYGLVGINFLLELGINCVLTPVIVRLRDLYEKTLAPRRYS